MRDMLMQFRHRQPSLSEIGIRVHVDNGRATQNGYGYDDLLKLRKSGLSPNAIGKVFNKTGQTIKKWLDEADKTGTGNS